MTRGMRTLLIPDSDIRSEAETAAFKGKLANVADFEHFVDYDCLVLARTGVRGVVARLVTDCFSTPPATVEALRSVKGDLTNRGLGIPLMNRERSDSTFGITKDVPKSLIVPGDSNFLGWYDKTPREPFCRPTAWSLERPDILEMSREFESDVHKVYREELPDHWQEQINFMKHVSPRFKYRESPYTTITINHNARFPYHFDEGDFAGGLGNLVVLDGGKDESGVMVMPRERVAFLVRPGDVLLMNVHALHGNLPLTEGQERLTAVLYAREKIDKCTE